MKISTFSHFLKLFKVALFNNKERDFKNLTNDSKNRQVSSSFIMNLVSKAYSNHPDKNGEAIKTQKTTLIDFSENCSIGTQQNKIIKEE